MISRSAQGIAMPLQTTMNGAIPALQPAFRSALFKAGSAPAAGARTWRAALRSLKHPADKPANRATPKAVLSS